MTVAPGQQTFAAACAELAKAAEPCRKVYTPARADPSTVLGERLPSC
jgi:hypothetical protein